MTRTKAKLQKLNLNSVQINQTIELKHRIHTMKTTHKLRQRVQALFGMLMVFAIVLGTSTDVFAQVPPANSSIGNQATATYLDNGSNSKSVTSNTVVTTVQQVAGVQINAGTTKQVSVGGQVTFAHVLTNTGNGNDSLLVSVSELANDFNFTNIRIYPDANKDGNADNLTEITSTPSLTRNGTAGSTFGIVIVADIPATANDGQFEDIVISVTSNFNNSETASATNRAEVQEDAVINVSKGVDQTTADVTNQVKYTINYSENGTAAATNLVLKDPIPTGMTYVPNSAVWSGSATALTDAAGGDPTGITFERKTGGAQDTLIAVIASVANGSSGTLSFDVTINSGQEGQTITNTVVFTHDDLTGDNTITGTPVQVNENYAIALVDAQDVVIDTTQQGATLNFINRYVNTGSTTDTYNIQTSNSNYPGSAQPLLYRSDGNGNPSSTYQDTGSDGIPDTGPVAPGDTVVVILQISLPANATGSNFSIDKTLTSINDATANATHKDKLGYIVPRTVDLTNDFAAGVVGALGEGKGPETAVVKSLNASPGSTVSFTLFVKNTSTSIDSYGLAVSDDTTAAGALPDPTALPAGWSVTFKDPNNGNSQISNINNLAAGASKQITAEVTVPAGYAPGTVDLFFRALSATTGASDIIHDAVVVQTDQNMQLSSNNTGQVSPGGSITYQHTLTILSNVTENNGTNSDLRVELTNSQAVGWTSVVYWDTNGDGVITNGTDSLLTSGAASGSVDLPAAVGSKTFNQTIKFIVKVTGLSSLDDGDDNTATLIVSDNVANLATKSNTDVTTIQAGLVKLDKFQAPDAGGSAGTYSKNPFNVLPGDTVYYRIVINNDGSQPVTTISVTDDTPTFTTMLIAATATVTSGTVTSVTVTSPPAIGATETIQVDIDQLDPTETVTLEFAVKVDS